MNRWLTWAVAGLILPVIQPALGQSGDLNLPRTVVAGTALSIPVAGSGQAVLYIAGPSQVIRREVMPGQPLSIAAEELNNAGHYVVALVTQSSTQVGQFDVVPSTQPASLSFLARPSRLPVGLQNSISGAVYVFDVFHNLITTPTAVSFQLSVPAGATQSRTVETRDGAAWTEMDSTPKEGNAKFVAQAGSISTTRVIQEVPGDPCGLKMSAHQVGDKVQLATDPLQDCSGNPVADGTIVTFTESWNGSQTSVDVPLKHGIAEAQVPAHDGANISVATGVVMGNEIHWESRE